MVKMFGLTGRLHYIIMLMATSAVSKWMDDEDDGQCPCMQYSPINPYAFINNHILQSSMPGSNINKPRLEEADSEMEDDAQTEESSSSPPDDFFGKNPDNL